MNWKLQYFTLSTVYYLNIIGIYLLSILFFVSHVLKNKRLPRKLSARARKQLRKSLEHISHHKMDSKHTIK